jgi:hypothetical protein
MRKRHWSLVVDGSRLMTSGSDLTNDERTQRQIFTLGLVANVCGRTREGKR